MSTEYDAIASLTRRLAEIPCNPAMQGKVVFTPRMLSGTPDINMAGIARDAQVLINKIDSGIIPGALNRLRKESPAPVEVLTIKATSHKGNVVVGLDTSFGIVIFYVHPEAEKLLTDIALVGTTPKTVEVIKEVKVNVPAPKPTGFWAKLAYAFS